MSKFFDSVDKILYEKSNKIGIAHKKLSCKSTCPASKILWNDLTIHLKMILLNQCELD